MEKTVFLRHDLAFITDKGKLFLQEQLLHFYQGTMLDMVEEILMGPADIPGIVRRDEPISPDTIPIGFVHYLRLDDNRIRIPARVPIAEVSHVMRPYDVIDLPVTPSSLYRSSRHAGEARAEHEFESWGAWVCGA